MSRDVQLQTSPSNDCDTFNTGVEWLSFYTIFVSSRVFSFTSSLGLHLQSRKTKKHLNDKESEVAPQTSTLQTVSPPTPSTRHKPVNNQSNYRQTSWQRKETMNKTKPAHKPSIHSKSTRQITSKPPMPAFLLGYIKCNPLLPPLKKPNNKG